MTDYSIINNIPVDNITSEAFDMIKNIYVSNLPTKLNFTANYKLL